MSKSAGSSPTPPKPKQADIAKINALATQTDKAAYSMSDADYARRFPQLVAGREHNVGSAVSNMSGQTDPQVAAALKQSGLGSPNLGGNEFQQARSLGQPILAKEQRDRNYFQTILSDNPQRAFGLSGGDVANLALANIGAQNAANQQSYATRIQGYNQNILQNAQTSSALYQALGSLAGTGIKAYGQSQSPYFTAGQYSTSSTPAYYGQSAPPSASGYGYDLPGGGY